MPIEVTTTSPKHGFVVILDQELANILKGIDMKFYDNFYRQASPMQKAQYLSLSDESGMVEYTPYNRVDMATHIYDEKHFKNPKRVKGKIAKVLRSLIPEDQLDKYPDRLWEDITNKYAAFSGEKPPIEIVSGQDLIDAYKLENYTTLRTGTELHGSCMGNKTTYMSLYKNNPNTIQMILRRDVFGKVEGRALLWTLTNGQKFMDRVYGYAKLVEDFRAYARANGFLYREANTDNARVSLTNGKESFSTDILITDLEHADYKQYPYLDTMGFVDVENKQIRAKDNGDPLRRVRATNGTYESVNPIKWYNVYAETVEEGTVTPHAAHIRGLRQAREAAMAASVENTDNHYCVLEEGLSTTDRYQSWIMFRNGAETGTRQVTGFVRPQYFNVYRIDGDTHTHVLRTTLSDDAIRATQNNGHTYAIFDSRDHINDATDQYAHVYVNGAFQSYAVTHINVTL